MFVSTVDSVDYQQISSQRMHGLGLALPTASPQCVRADGGRMGPERDLQRPCRGSVAVVLAAVKATPAVAAEVAASLDRPW